MQKKWYRLDTAALIFPAIARQDWCNAFRFSATLKEAVAPDILQQAVNDMKKRFPTFFVALRKGFFWYYLEESDEQLTVQPDYAYPLTFMRRKDLAHHCVRVLYYKNRIAVEIFHSVTDGHGGSVFISNLVAHYLELKCGIEIPRSDLIFDLSETPEKQELENSFFKHSAMVASGRKEAHAYRLHGTREPEGFKYLTTGIVDTRALIDAAHRYGVSVTSFLAAVMTESVMAIQNLDRPLKKQKPVKISLAIDLRRLFGSKTLRNFALAMNTEIDPRFGNYTLEEICTSISHQLGATVTKQNMAGMIAANVQLQQSMALRLVPLFLKDIGMNVAYESVGETVSCLNISNITKVDIPPVMQPYIERMEFIIGTQRSYPNNCSVLSYGGKTYINMIRNIREAELERRFFSRLVELDVPVEIESNRR